MKKWEIKSKLKGEDVINILLENRGINTKNERDEFLNPKLDSVTVKTVGIDTSQLKKAVKRIKKAIKSKEQIVVFGDYDVDGICGSAILWETLYRLGVTVMPYIPHRIDEGYGLSIKGIDNVSEQIANVSLIITVDNGIVANVAVSHASKKGIDVIITDHHVPSSTPPKAHAIIHTTLPCGAGVGYLLSREILKQVQDDIGEDDHLELVALATIADLVPLTGANRTLTKFGLEKLRQTKRLGLLALFKEAALDAKTLGSYHVGHIIAPRLNAMGRLEYAMDSLRLLCTTNPKRAEDLAQLLGSTNKDRQELTAETVQHALSRIRNKELRIKKLLFLAHETYQQGVIGLVAGKLVEEYYRPSIVVSIGKEYSKASARSVKGFNIIEFIRSASEHLIDAGGHPMAAGFTVETKKLTLLQSRLERLAEEQLTEEALTRILRIDMEIPLNAVTEELYKAIQKLAPFGMGNPEPVFVSRDVVIDDMRLVGRDQNHVKLRVSSEDTAFDAIAFGLAPRSSEFHIGNKLDIAYSIGLDEWNGRKKLQIKIKDIRDSISQ